MSSELPDQELLIQHLLGALPDAEAERLDELSITDDEIAWRLAAAENDLVDSYVRGELSGEVLERFRAHYLSSQRRREKVRFADTLFQLGHGAATSPSESAAAMALPPSVPSKEHRAPFRSMPVWALATAALVLLLPAGFLLLANGRLRRELTLAQSRHAALETRTRDLQKQLGERPPAATEARNGIEGKGVDRPAIERLQIASLVLLPQRRGPGRVAVLSLPAGTDVVALQLKLESDEFPRYEVRVRNAAANDVLWGSGRIESAIAGDGKSVTVSLPAALLSPGHFSANLSGIAADGRSELLNSYAFEVRVVR